MEFSFYFHGKSLWGMAWTKSEGDVRLAINSMINKLQEFDVSFDTLFSSCVSHEIIHSVLQENIGSEANDAFDDICYNKNKNIKTWFGGMPDGVD